MIVILCIGLYTSRVVLNALGVSDYGLYNVVGGFVAFFAFLNGAMSTATQRFITFELAGGDLPRQRLTFSTSLIIHFIVGSVIVLLAETVGLWFVCCKLEIPDGRLTAAIWVYQFSIITTFLTIVSIPYNAAIIAHEKMSAFAYISIMDAFLKLVIVISISYASCDRLILYAFLLCLVSVLDRIIYGVYCSRHFPEAHFERKFNKQLFKDMTGIAGWNLFGNIAGVGYTQGLNVLLNIFFGTVINAARGIAVTIQGVVTGFVSNFQMALNPQITKSYAVHDLDRMHSLIYASSKFSFFLLFMLALPIALEAQTILELWLKIVPDDTVWFSRLILCVVLIDTTANPLMIASQAVGKVKFYQCVVGGLLLMILPVAYVVLKLGGSPLSVFIVQLIMAMVAQMSRILIVGKMVEMSLRAYCRKVILPIARVSAMAFLLSASIYYFAPTNLWASLGVILAAVIITALTIFTLGLSDSERKLIVDKIKSFRKSRS